MPMGSLQPQRGFTLLETFVELVILGFVLAGLAMMMFGNILTGREARRFSAASALAAQKMEDLRALGYTAAVALGSGADATTLNETGGTTGVTPFTRCWTIADPATALAGTKYMTVNVVWTDDIPGNAPLTCGIAAGGHLVQLQSKLAQ